MGGPGSGRKKGSRTSSPKLRKVKKTLTKEQWAKKIKQKSLNGDYGSSSFRRSIGIK